MWEAGSNRHNAIGKTMKSQVGTIQLYSDYNKSILYRNLQKESLRRKERRNSPNMAHTMVDSQTFRIIT